MSRSRRPTSAFASLLLAVALLASACGRGTDGGLDGASAAEGGAAERLSAIHPLEGDRPTAALPVTVRGADDQLATITSTERIVALAGGVAEVVWSLGLGDRVVARDVSTTFPEAAAVPVVTNGHSISTESLLALRPTVVLADPRVGPATAIAQLRAANVPVVVIPLATTIAGVTPRIRAVANALGVPDAGERLLQRTADEIAKVAADVPESVKGLRVAFLYLRGTASVYLIGGRGSGADGLLQAAGAVDVGAAAGLADYTPLTAEALVQLAPDVILVMQEGLDSVGGVDGLVQLNGVAQTPAGRDRRVVAVDDGLLLGFGPRVAGAVAAVAEGLAAA